MLKQSNSNRLSVCTIVSKNYLSYARVLTESFLAHNEGDVFVLLVDRLDGYFDPKKEHFTLIELEELREYIRDLDSFCFKYSILELNTAVKPFLLEYIFQHYGLQKLLYLDPDILVVNNLDELSNQLDSHSLVLTPHITSPIEDKQKPSELDLLRAGTYNLGFLGLSNTKHAKAHLKWWQKRLYDNCVVAFDVGIFVDQKWMDLVPGMYDDIFILRHPGYNVAYWNYHYRKVQIKDDAIQVNGQSAYFLHFSGFNPENINNVSKYQDRFKLDDLDNMRPLFELYRNKLYDNGWQETKTWPYAFDYFDNGVKIPSFLHHVYLHKEFQITPRANPFETSSPGNLFQWLNTPVHNNIPTITRILLLYYYYLPDIKEKFPDVFYTDRRKYINWILSNAYGIQIDENFLKHINSSFSLENLLDIHNLIRAFRHEIICAYKLVKYHKNDVLYGLHKFLIKVERNYKRFFPSNRLSTLADYKRNIGINISGYIQAESGTGEAVRANIRALNFTSLPYTLNSIPSDSRQQEKRYNNFSKDNPYRFNLIHVNADQSQSFRERMGSKYFKKKYNIGFWYWELSDFPREMQDSFSYYDEIWVGSSFCQDSFSKVSPIPVIKIPPSISPETASNISRKHFDIPENKFTFFYMFDFLSFIERKNPFAVVEAFRSVFSLSDDAHLVIKSINSQANPNLKEALEKQAKGCSIQIIDKYLSKREVNSLVSLCDSYVSLHRSEGFGLPIAEAMYLEKPVIATGYSGNMDFMNFYNSFPVKYDLIEIREDCGPYKAGMTWADPDTEHAAELMRYVYNDLQQARKIGLTASNFVKSHFSPEKTGTLIQQRIENIIAHKDLA